MNHGERLKFNKYKIFWEVNTKKKNSKWRDHIKVNQRCVGYKDMFLIHLVRYGN